MANNTLAWMQILSRLGNPTSMKEMYLKYRPVRPSQRKSNGNRTQKDNRDSYSVWIGGSWALATQIAAHRAIDALDWKPGLPGKHPS